MAAPSPRRMEALRPHYPGPGRTHITRQNAHYHSEVWWSGLLGLFEATRGGPHLKLGAVALPLTYLRSDILFVACFPYRIVGGGPVASLHGGVTAAVAWPRQKKKAISRQNAHYPSAVWRPALSSFREQANLWGSTKPGAGFPPLACSCGNISFSALAHTVL